MEKLNEALSNFLNNVPLPSPQNAWEKEWYHFKTPFERVTFFTDPDGDRILHIFVPVYHRIPEVDLESRVLPMEGLTRRYVGMSENGNVPVQRSLARGRYGGNKPYVRFYAEVSQENRDTIVSVQFTQVSK